MGNVSSKDIEYKSYVLSDVKVIELLISMRYKYDDYLFTGMEDSSFSVEGALPFHEEMLVTYISLDKYISDCKFNDLQLKMIEMVEQGYTQIEIAEKTGLRLPTVKGRLKTIYNKIVKENEWQWRKSIYLNKIDLKSKMCSKCRVELPATVEFFYYKDDTEDGFHRSCKKCF